MSRFLREEPAAVEAVQLEAAGWRATLIARPHSARLVIELPAGYRQLGDAVASRLERRAAAACHLVAAAVLPLLDDAPGRWAWPDVRDLIVSLEGAEGAGERAASLLALAFGKLPAEAGPRL